MSNGPEGYHPHEGQDGPEEAVPGGQLDPRVDAALARTNIPGIVLIVVGVLNVLGGGWIMFKGAQILVNPVQALEESRQSQDLARQMGLPATETTPELLTMSAYTYVASGLVILIASGFVVMAGARMRTLTGYGFALTGAVLAVIPCLSPSVCCLGLGMFAGIWALVVLANPEVRSAFQ